MLKLILIGLCAGLFFSSTFVLNRVMSVEGGHWVWSGALRFFYMILFLIVYQSFTQGPRFPKIIRLFFSHWKFWVTAGGIGFGCFYSLICFSADHAPGWVIATTWQLTIIASLIVLIVFGRSFPKKVWLFSCSIFAGVVVVNVTYMKAGNFDELLLGGIPVLIAAFCYPIGNQLVWEASNGNRLLPDIRSELLKNPFNKVLLMSLGSVPFWLMLIFITSPPSPSSGQFLNTALVALFSGVFATTLFLHARNRATKASELAAVDATQSSEVVFAMIGEVIVLHTPFPSGVAIVGVLMVFVGLTCFVCFQEK